MDIDPPMSKSSHTRSARFKVLMRRIHNPHRKRPHVLPPLPNLQPLVLRPMDPLQPPDLLLMENRSGSPAPKRNIPRDSDYDFNGNDGKPMIKISDHCRKEHVKEAMKVDLLSDPIFTEPSDLLHKLQKMNSLKITGLETKRYDRQNSYPDNVSKQQIKILPNDLEKKSRSLSVTPLDDVDDRGGSCCPDIQKVVQIPSRYAPLKPIGQGVSESDNSQPPEDDSE